MTAESQVVSSMPAESLPAHQAVRRRKIIDAAGELLQSSTYELIQIRDVAARADVALGTLYRYFSSKEHLYAATFAAWGEGFTLGLIPGVTPLERLDSRMRMALRAFEKRPQYYRVLILLLGSADANALAIMDRFRVDLDSAVRADFDELDPDSAADFTHLFWGVMNQVLIDSIFHGGLMVDAYRRSDRFLGLLRLQFGEGRRSDLG